MKRIAQMEIIPKQNEKIETKLPILWFEINKTKINKYIHML